MNTFTLPDEYTIECRAENTRYGFRHLASLRKGYHEVAKDKACYYNRTWECFEFQTVAHGVVYKYFGDEKAKEYNTLIDKQGRGEVDQTFRTVGMIASLANVFCEDKEDKNKWKQRMLKAGLPGLDFPEDFDNLPEEEKEKRLNKVVNLTLNKEV